MQTKKLGCVYAGADVGARSVVVVFEREHDRLREQFEITNDPAGHRALIKRLRKHGATIRFCIESTGVYGLELACAVHGAGIEIMVANPRAVSDFAKALLQRSKTDSVDAQMILQFLLRMPFVAWTPPEATRFELRAIMRRVGALKENQTQEKNRLHVASRTSQMTSAIRKDLAASLRQLKQRIRSLETAALDVVKNDPELLRAFMHLISTKGIAKVAALQILSEICLLAPSMTARQWVAHAGLDPREYSSGTSVQRRPRISRVGNAHLRAALYLPALGALTRDPNVRAFYLSLVDRGKPKMQAVVAVMRKLLHSIYGMLRTDTDFDGARFYPAAA